jgi:hypothetical protein
MLNKFDIPYAALIVKADARKKASIQLARSILSGFNVQVLDTEIPLLNAFKMLRLRESLLIVQSRKVGDLIGEECWDFSPTRKLAVKSNC